MSKLLTRMLKAMRTNTQLSTGYALAKPADIFLRSTWRYKDALPQSLHMQMIQLVTDFGDAVADEFGWKLICYHENRLIFQEEETDQPVIERVDFNKQMTCYVARGCIVGNVSFRLSIPPNYFFTKPPKDWVEKKENWFYPPVNEED